MAPPVTTEDHIQPTLDLVTQSRPVLIAVYPNAVLVPLPSQITMLGRNWLARFGHEDSQISSHHAQLSWSAGSLHVEDAGSRNGTWINGVRLAPRDRLSIPDGTLLRLGNSVFVYRLAFVGPDRPAPPIDLLVGPFGLHGVRVFLEEIVRQAPCTVLIEGETGTGKELVARAIARRLGRDKVYAPVNVAGIPSGVFDSQLFGYVKGAYSGAGTGSKGVFLTHDGGAVFLDEIGDLPLDVQPKLLRVLENREILSVGADRPRSVDLLILAATNRELEPMVASGSFRRDLFARLASCRLELPPLRERSEDIFSIAQSLMQRRDRVATSRNIEVEAIERLILHAWPGNVRELASVLDAALAAEPVPSLRLRALHRFLGALPTNQTVLTPERLGDALARCDGNESQAAKLLGITRGRLRRFRETTQR